MDTGILDKSKDDDDDDSLAVDDEKTDTESMENN